MSKALSVWRDLLQGVRLVLVRRRSRTLLLLIGPTLAGAIIVGAIGILESTQGHLRNALREMGTELIRITPDEGSEGGATLPASASLWALKAPGVDQVATIAKVTGVVAFHQPPNAAETRFPLGGEVLAASTNLLELLDTGISAGRLIQAADEAGSTEVALVSESLESGVAGGLLGRTILLSSQPFVVVGVFKESLVYPRLNGSILIPASTAQRWFGVGGEPSEVLVRVENRMEELAPLLENLVTFDSPDDVAVARTARQLLWAETEIDRSLTAAVLMLGGLAMLMGAGSILTVMSLSLVERRKEIGLRRAIGQRSRLIAMQFVLEGAALGLVGGVLGVAVGLIVVVGVAMTQGWSPQFNPSIAVATFGASTVSASLAALYPASRSRLISPLSAMRLE